VLYKTNTLKKKGKSDSKKAKKKVRHEAPLSQTHSARTCFFEE